MRFSGVAAGPPARSIEGGRSRRRGVGGAGVPGVKPSIIPDIPSSCGLNPAASPESEVLADPVIKTAETTGLRKGLARTVTI